MCYKILSLDGGGSWALLQARILQDLYGDIRGHALLKEFDLVIANSGGSLVLACLCNDMKPSEILQIFNSYEKRTKVFSPLKPDEYNLLSLLRAVFKKFPVGAKYRARRKREGLVEILAAYDRGRATPIVQTPLRQLPALIGKESLQIMIVGFDYFRERGTFFRSNPRSLTDKFNKKYYEVTLGDAIHASSNAPVNFFQEYAEVAMECLGPDREKKTNWFWDGAVAGFNNPVLAGLVEAMTNEPARPLDDFRILSIGTGAKGKAVIVDHKYSDNPVLQERYRNSRDLPYVLSDESIRYQLEIGKLAQSILSDPPDSATFMAYAIINRRLDGTANLVRINPCITPQVDRARNTYILPEVYRGEMEKFMDILGLDMDAVEDAQVALINDIADKFIVHPPGQPCLPNQFIRGEQHSDEQLGLSTYREARQRWMEIKNCPEDHLVSAGRPVPAAP